MKKSLKYVISLSFVVFFMTLSVSKAAVALKAGDTYIYTAHSNDSTFQPSEELTLAIKTVTEELTEVTIGYNVTGLTTGQTVDATSKWDPTETVNSPPKEPSDASIEATAMGLRELILKGEAWIMKSSFDFDWTTENENVSIKVDYDDNGVLVTFHLTIAGVSIEIDQKTEDSIPGYPVFVIGLLGFITAWILIKRKQLYQTKEV